jgi:hypothetical protein
MLFRREDYARALKSKAFGEFWSSKREIFLGFLLFFLILFCLDVFNFIIPF